MDPLEQYLCHQVTDVGECPSHTSMVGGKWFVPKEDDEHFFRLYLDALELGHRQYLSERILPGRQFKFFLDIDMSDEIVNELVAHNEYYDALEFHRKFSEESEFIVREIVDNNVRSIFSRKPSSVYKFHVNFPTFPCNRTRAIDTIRRIRDHFVVQFNIATSPLLSNVNWTKVFDALPYSGGLRMPGSLKSAADNEADAYQIMDLVTGEVNLDFF